MRNLWSSICNLEASTTSGLRPAEETRLRLLERRFRRDHPGAEERIAEGPIWSYRNHETASCVRPLGYVARIDLKPPVCKGGGTMEPDENGLQKIKHVANYWQPWRVLAMVGGQYDLLTGDESTKDSSVPSTTAMIWV